MPSNKDNNELDEILDDLIAELFVYKEQVNTGVINAGQAVEFEAEFIKVAKSKLDQHYADLYRNKIPKKINAEMPNATTVAYNRAIDDITAQFNSKGDK